MIAHVNHDLSALAFETNKARNDLDHSVSKLSSGKKIVRAGDDTGGYQQAAKLGSKNRRDVATMQNLQSLVSYSNTQDGALQTVGKILERMNTLAMRALDVTSTDADRENYNKEFIELAAQLDEIKREKFNGLDLFGAGGFSDEKQEFIDSLKNGWLESSETIVNGAYGWTVDNTDDWDLIVNENDTGGYAAFVKTSSVVSPGPNFGTSNVIEMQFDLPDFTAPHTQPTSEADRTVAHEMVHLMQAQNSYFGDLTGDGSSSASWFKEGLAEFIHGGDDRVRGILGNGPSDADITALLNAIGTGNESWTANDQYAAGYLAARYLHSQIQSAPTNQAAGVKHLTQWMKTGFDAGNGSAASGLNTYFQTFTSYADTNAFIADFKGANGLNFVKTSIVPNLANVDTGSIRGSDAGGGGTLSGQDVVPDSTANPAGKVNYEEEKGSLEAGIDGTGATWNLQSVNTIAVSDTATYNLESISNARGTLTQLTSWLENLGTERSLVGANLSRLQKEIDNLNGKIASGELAVSRIEDADVARESTLFATNQVRMQASVAILAQARQTNVMLADLVRGVQVGG